MIGITGVTGTLGSALRKQWPEIEQTHFQGDIRDFDAVQDWVDSARPAQVLHLAAIVPVRQVEEDPKAAFEVNVQGTVNLCEALGRRRNPTCVPWLFVASTSHVYAPSSEPISESQGVVAPLSFYGRTKWMSEQAAFAWGERFSFPVCAGRIFSYSAPDQSSDFLIPSLAKRVREAPPDAALPLRGAEQVRDFLSARSVSAAVKLLSERCASGIYNIGSGYGIRIADLAAAVAAYLGRPDVRFTAEDNTPGALVADTAKIRELGFAPSSALENLVRETLGE